VDRPPDLAPDAVDGDDEDAEHEQVDHGLLPPLEAVRPEGDLILEPLDAHPPAAATTTALTQLLKQLQTDSATTPTPRDTESLVEASRTVPTMSSGCLPATAYKGYWARAPHKNWQSGHPAHRAARPRTPLTGGRSTMTTSPSSSVSSAAAAAAAASG